VEAPLEVQRLVDLEAVDDRRLGTRHVIRRR
jgi:hypothetical protein